MHFRTLDSTVARPIDTHSPRTIFGLAWTRDSRRILYLQDQEGDENFHVAGNFRNALHHYREVEDFLASCLGGRRSAGGGGLRGRIPGPG